MDSGKNKENQPTKPDAQYCSQCGAETVPGENYCANCGYQLQQMPGQPQEQAPRSEWPSNVPPTNQPLQQNRAPVCSPPEVHSGWLIGIGGGVLIIVGLLLTLSGFTIADAFTLILGMVCLAVGVILLVQAFRHSPTSAVT